MATLTISVLLALTYQRPCLLSLICATFSVKSSTLPMLLFQGAKVPSRNKKQRHREDHLTPNQETTRRPLAGHPKTTQRLSMSHINLRNMRSRNMPVPSTRWTVRVMYALTMRPAFDCHRSYTSCNPYLPNRDRSRLSWNSILTFSHSQPWTIVWTRAFACSRVSFLSRTRLT